MGQLWKKPSGVNFPLCTFSGAVRAVWTLCGPTSNLQGNSGSAGSGWAAGHTAVLAAVDLLHPPNVQGPAADVLLHEGSGTNLKLTWRQKNDQNQLVDSQEVSSVYVYGGFQPSRSSACRKVKLTQLDWLCYLDEAFQMRGGMSSR